jgi:hypothetical protein
MTERYHTKYGLVSLLSNDIHFHESFARGQYWDEDTLLKLNCYIDPDKNILEIGGHVGTTREKSTSMNRNRNYFNCWRTTSRSMD